MHADRRTPVVLLAVLYAVAGALCLIGVIWPMHPGSPIGLLLGIAVIGLTGLLLHTELDEQQRDLLSTVSSSGDALLAVINDVLDFSKIEAGELHLERQAFDLRQCAESSLDLVAPLAATKGLDLVLNVEQGCPAACWATRRGYARCWSTC